MSTPAALPVVQTLNGPVVVDLRYEPDTSSLSAPALAPMTKWAGQPGDGAFMGGTNNGSTEDDNYDPKRKPSPYAEVGASGLAQYGGFVQDEFLPQLQGDRGLKAMREMYDNDSIIGALVFAIQMMLRKVEWRVDPPHGASVEEIVDRRIKERQQRELEHQQKQQMQMASMMQPSPTATGPGGQPAAPAQRRGPTAPRATGLDQAGPTSQPISKRVRSMFRKSSSMNLGTPQAADPGMDAELNIDGDPLMNPDAPGAPAELTPEERKAEELAVFVETCFHDMTDSWADTLAQIVTMIVFGFSFHEIVYKKRSGTNLDVPEKSSRFDDARVGWAKLAGRAQETRHRWEFDDNGNVIGMWQMAPPKFKLRYIPLTKALLFRTTAYKGNPEGRSLFRSAYRAWHFKRRAEEYEAIGIERDLAGIPVAYVPYQMMTVSATDEEKAALEEIKKIVRNLRVNEQNGVVFPMALDPETKQPLYKLELLSSPRRGAAQDTDRVITRYEQRQAMTVLADFILLGHEGVGSKALGETKADLFATVLEAILNSIADVINTHAIPRLMQMNGEDPALSPKLTFGSLKQTALSDTAALITAMAGAGADLFPDEQLEDHVRESAGWPPKAATEDL